MGGEPLGEISASLDALSETITSGTVPNVSGVAETSQ